jgi:predicted transposase/invertase (TIGR01784 family)
MQTQNTSLEQATGTIDYSFTNDYMFRAILQKNERVLKALICALLHLKAADIRSIVITNPIVLGETITDKEFILDISILMNSDTKIDLEMQVNNLLNWEERSLSYLCRNFDQLHSGEDYAHAGPAIHIGFLDYTPFKDAPEFYATYKMLNVKNHRLYSDKFTLSVLDLTQINLATEEDKAYHIDRWARLFKAKTWEELKMIAAKDDALLDASKTLYSLNGDETIRAQCRAREDYDRLHNAINRTIEQLTADKEQLTADKEQLTADKEQLTADKEQLTSRMDILASENSTLTSENNTLVSENDTLRKLLQEHGIPYPTSED